eukprot:6201471-Pleurochrysis_carterae.AAC.2
MHESASAFSGMLKVQQLLPLACALPEDQPDPLPFHRPRPTVQPDGDVNSPHDPTINSSCILSLLSTERAYVLLLGRCNERDDTQQAGLRLGTSPKRAVACRGAVRCDGCQGRHSEAGCQAMSGRLGLDTAHA